MSNTIKLKGIRGGASEPAKDIARSIIERLAEGDTNFDDAFRFFAKKRGLNLNDQGQMRIQRDQTWKTLVATLGNCPSAWAKNAHVLCYGPADEEPDVDTVVRVRGDINSPGAQAYLEAKRGNGHYREPTVVVPRRIGMVDVQALAAGEEVDPEKEDE